MSLERCYDCLIVGARVAGAATAILLANLGHRVLLVDRRSTLGPTLSTHVFGEWEAFGPLGVADALAASGHLRCGGSAPTPPAASPRPTW
ncbi:hypothetical protein CDO52_11625 [Nocardiopsis gilva YIM 90087]|uniref:FAD-binding domain-containing protein n=1 Tax=Nocardiopsis gilva YIM 90087 TaxID=1235441 RepID=A0A223S5P3_9ACTN|nr:NAD(P)-binding protein [Nocardiopsis gilva]ASU83339.1 hypothetical protein CDO52_11625 [Nocardiopsis gilva YIM 90087]